MARPRPNNSAKIQDGLNHLQEAEKYMKTSFFKWTPDYYGAADRFIKASLCFKVGQSYEQAKDTSKKAAECYEKTHQLFHAAKALTEAASICSIQKNYEEIMTLMAKAVCLFREHGTPDTACINLANIAKMIESAVPLKAIQLYEEAAEIAENDEKFREAAAHLNNASRLLVNSKEYLRATKTMKKQIDIYCKVENYPMAFNLVLGQVLVFLTEGDFVAADNCYKNAFDYPGYSSSDVAEALEQILEAYSSGDNKLLKTVTSKPIVSCQDIAIARLGKALKAPEGGGGFDEYGTDDKKDEPEVPVESLEKLDIGEEELDEGIC